MANDAAQLRIILILSCAGTKAETQRANISKRELLATTVTTLTAGSACWDQNGAEALPFGLFEDKGPKLPPNVVLDRTLAYTFTYPLKVLQPIQHVTCITNLGCYHVISHHEPKHASPTFPCLWHSVF